MNEGWSLELGLEPPVKRQSQVRRPWKDRLNVLTKWIETPSPTGAVLPLPASSRGSPWANSGGALSVRTLIALKSGTDRRFDLITPQP